MRGGLPQSEPRLRQEFTCPRSPCTWASWHCGGVTAETRARTPMSWRPCMNWTFELLSHAATYSQYDLASALDKSDENPPDGQYVPTSTRNGCRNRCERKNQRRALVPLLHVHEIRVFVDLLLRVPVQPRLLQTPVCSRGIPVCQVQAPGADFRRCQKE